MKFTKLEPLEDRVLVKEIKKSEERTDGGLIIPDSAKKEVREGEMYAVGPGRYAPDTGTFIPTVLHVGDIVLFGINQGTEVEVGEPKQTLRMMREGDILMVISKKSKED